MKNSFANTWTGFAVTIVLMLAAFHFGWVWDTAVNPQPNVRVQFSKDRVETGSLSRTWNGDHLLVTDDGRSIQFREGYESMSWTTPREDERPVRWRTMLPTVLVMLAWFSLAFGPLVDAFVRRRRHSNG